jgi:hypothetical protein
VEALFQHVSGAAFAAVLNAVGDAFSQWVFVGNPGPDYQLM